MFTLLFNFYKFCRNQGTCPLSILLIGLDNAGKTTLLTALSGHVDPETVPTYGFNTETICEGKQHITYLDVGGGENIRGIWPRYFSEVHGTIFVVDSADVSRLEEAKESLHSILSDDRLHGKPMLVLANKQDLEESSSAVEVAKAIGLDEISGYSFCIIGGIARTPAGSSLDSEIRRGLGWLLDQIHSRIKFLKRKVEADTIKQKENDEREMDARRKRVEKMREERRKAEAEESNELEDTTTQRESTTDSGEAQTVAKATRQRTDDNDMNDILREIQGSPQHRTEDLPMPNALADEQI